MTDTLFLENFKTLLLQQDFEAITPTCYFRVENPVLYAICLQNDVPQKQIIENLYQNLDQFYCQRLICIFISTENDMPPLLYEHTHNDTYFFVTWHYNIETNTLTTAPDAPSKILGIEKMLKKAVNGDISPAYTPPEIQKHQKPLVTYAIFGICAVLMLYAILSGEKELLLDTFCTSDISVFVDKEYYRLLTAMFFHTGFMHIAANSIYLFYFGTRAELLLGHWRYLLFYILCGLCGSVASVCLSGYPAVGASGAIFGILGGMLVAVKKYGSAHTGMNYATLLLLATSALLMGFLDIGIDNYAHLGGFFCGVFLFFAMTKNRKN